ncbi:SDR family NAD(P)-dependent oxidoreductase [Benzoatithermus flavus]|uniref:Glucose 1-dehydrogenase n=1 Tax=Benzoatithermus flavus TaxID=3108223 RepID=A0ABU8XTK5_9PROT
MLEPCEPAFTLHGRKALVTGASRGIGEALAIGLARFGADVAIAAREPARLASCAAAIEAEGRRALPLAMDVREVESVRDGVAKAAETLSGLDILVNNAGTEQVCPSLEVDEALWDRIVDTNLKGAFFAAQAAAWYMKADRGGTIVNICSLTSAVGVPTAVPYGSSKAGLLGMTRALAAEWAPLGIRVNAIGPGYFRTELTETFYRDEGWTRTMLGKIPAGRFGDLRDLVGTAVFLCSDAARYVTGQILYVDGGYMASI